MFLPAPSLEEKMLRVAALSLILLTTWSLPALAQQPQSHPSLNSQQLEGLRHFNQACRVCHTKPQLTSPQYAPVLRGSEPKSDCERMVRLDVQPVRTASATKLTIT